MVQTLQTPTKLTTGIKTLLAHLSQILTVAACVPQKEGDPAAGIWAPPVHGLAVFAIILYKQEKGEAEGGKTLL